MNKNEFREFEYLGWQQSVDGYANGFCRLTRQMIPHILESFDALNSMRLLDVACGLGDLSAAAARQGADVTAIDFSENMITRARQLHGEITFDIGDAEDLVYNDSCFDMVVMNFGLLHLGSPERAVHEAFRVLKPGGIFSYTIWAPPERSLAFKIVLDAIEAHGANVSLPDGPAFFKYSDESESNSILKSVGFSNIRFREFALNWSLESSSSLFDAFYEGSARVGGLLRAQSSDCIVQIKTAMKKEMRNYFYINRYALPMAAIVVSGQKGRTSYQH